MGENLAEPSATKGTEEAGTEAVAAEARFEHAPPAAPTAEAAAEEASEPAAASGAGLAGLADRRPPTGAPEWPVAWLRLVEPDQPTPEDEAVAAVIAAEAADADGVAHAFGQVMAAALDPDAGADEPEPKTADPALETLEAEAESETASEPASAEAEPAARPVEKAARFSVAAEAEALKEPFARPRPAKPMYEPRNFAVRKSRLDREVLERRAGENAPAKAVYLLYLAGFLIVPAVLGLAIALNARRDAPEWLESHYVYQVRTFWIGLCAAAVGTALLLSGALTLFGLVLSLLLIVWLVARSALGFVCVVKLQPYPRPRAWML